MPINQLNLPAIYGAAENVKGQRIQNQLGQQQLDQANQPQPVDPEDLRRAIDWADTPQKWDQAVDLFVSEGRPEFARYKGQFGQRDELKALFASQAEKNDPGSPLGKLARDFENGIIDEPTYRAAVKKAIAPAKSQVKITNNVGPTGIDYGPPPSNMAWARDESGEVLLREGGGGLMAPVAVPVAGGPVETGRIEAEKAERIKKQTKGAQADIVAEDIDRAVSMVENANIPVTGIGSLLSAVPGTPAHDLAAKLDTIKANIGFDKLQAMREASKTGGALGQVSEFENRMLQATMGSLLQSQTKEEFMFNLRRMKDTYLDIIHGPGNRPGQDKPQGGEFSGMSDEDFAQVPLTGDNAATWLEEAKKRGLTQ